MKKKLLIAVFISISAVLCASVLTLAQQAPVTQIVGGLGGAAFLDPSPELGARVIEVQVHSGEFVDSVQFVYMFRDGHTAIGPQHGGPGGVLSVFHLDADEFLIGISGRTGTYIDSIQFLTNKRSSPPFGGDGGNREFRVAVPENTAASGMAGRSGQYLDAIGLTFAPMRREYSSGYGGAPQPGQTPVAGGPGGSVFDEGNIPDGAEILEVRVRAGDFINSIQLVYAVRGGRTLEANRHGGNDGRPSSFRLQPGEYIVGISGRSGEYVDSFLIQTNRRKSQVFGGRGGDRDFQINIPEGNRATGFTGRSGEFVDAIGMTYAETPDQRRDHRDDRRNR